jgi:hypothetical protein
MNCPTCAEPLAERGVFCKACAAQARCMKCRELLEPGATACVECGTRIGQPVEAANGTAQGAASSVSALPANRNTLTYNEDRNSRRFEASLTDSAMHGLGDVFGELFAQRGVGRTITQTAGKTLLRNDVTLDDLKQLPPAPPPVVEQEDMNKTAAPAPPDRDRVLKIFSTKGEALELTDNRLKAKNGADYLRKLTYLFIYAHECHGRPSTTEHDVKAMLRAAKMWDGSGNANRWLNKRIGIVSEGDDRVKLNATGREDAQKSLNAILDASIPDEWNPDKASTKPKATKKKKD